MVSFDERRRVMVDTQVRPSDVTRFPVIEAMLAVPRERFVPESAREAAYAGENVSLGDGRVVLEPRTIAKILDAVNIQPTEAVLDVGCGLGYSTALAAQLAEAVVGLEANRSMARDAEQTLSDEGVDNAVVVEGELAAGMAAHGPYDVILVQGGVEQVPQAFTEQLNDGGRIACIFMDGALGVVRLGLKADGAITWRFSFNAAAPVLEGFTAERAFSL
ncbi:MAG: protein-L-isoaspartate O-methyltransferase [Pseudomonadota bacterium]